jgi:hypothetical protein
VAHSKLSVVSYRGIVGLPDYYKHKGASMGERKLSPWALMALGSLATAAFIALIMWIGLGPFGGVGP